MFCPECGTNNVDNAQFCENCGTKLEQPVTPVQPTQATPVNPAPVAPRKPMPKSAKIILIAVLAVAVLLTAGFFVCKNITNPKNIVTDYAKAYVSHDAKVLFKTIGFTETPFINATNFEKSLKTNKEAHFNDASDYDIELTTPESSVKSASTLSYRITFRDSTNAFEYSMDVKLTKQSSKAFLFFNNWKIKPENFLSKDCTIQVPENSKITLDGVSLDLNKYAADVDNSDNQNSSSEQLDTYKIPYLFAGSHSYKISLENFKDKDVTFSTITSDYDSGQVSSTSVGDLELADTVQSTLIDTSKSILTSTYEGALAKKDFAEAITPDAISVDQSESFKYNYDNLVEYNVKSDTHLKSVEFTAMDGSLDSASYNYTYGGYTATINLDTSYTAKSVVKSFWDNKKSNKSQDGEGTYTFSYTYNDGKWWLVSTNAFSACVNYTRY